MVSHKWSTNGNWGGRLNFFVRVFPYCILVVIRYGVEQSWWKVLVWSLFIFSSVHYAMNATCIYVGNCKTNKSKINNLGINTLDYRSRHCKTHLWTAAQPVCTTMIRYSTELCTLLSSPDCSESRLTLCLSFPSMICPQTPSAASSIK
jgi:hypothetical protein